MKALVFVGCGQTTPEERALGKAIFEIVQEDGRYEPYFAENQSSLDGVTQNILARLVEAEAFVAILHPRGDVAIPSLTSPTAHFTRASVWIEQEIAILATLAQMYRKQVRFQLYARKGVAREGLRLFVMSNPVEFESEAEVVEHFRLVLPTWNLQVTQRAVGAAEDELLAHAADSGEVQILATDQAGRFVVRALECLRTTVILQWRFAILTHFANSWTTALCERKSETCTGSRPKGLGGRGRSNAILHGL